MYSLLGQHPYEIITITNDSKIPAKIEGINIENTANIEIPAKIRRTIPKVYKIFILQNSPVIMEKFFINNCIGHLRTDCLFDEKIWVLNIDLGNELQ